MDEAEQLCDRIAIMDKGRILVLDTLTGLQKLMPGGNRLEIGVKIPAAVAPAAPSSGSQRLDLSASLGGLPGVSHVEMLSTDPAEEIAQGQEMVTYRLYAENVEAVAVSALQVVAQAGAELRELRLAHPSLEDVFITLTGRTLRS
jgi:ABC-2 type transport system ATP-binding protein